MVSDIYAVNDRDLNFKLYRINWLDQEITRYRDYEWTATSFHTAFFVAILYFLIDSQRNNLIKATGSNILVLPIFLYLIIACYQLRDIHIKLNRSRNERNEYLRDIGEPRVEEIKGVKFIEGKGAYITISFIIWLIFLFAIDVILLVNSGK
jgi:hypothetical protein